MLSKDLIDRIQGDHVIDPYYPQVIVQRALASKSMAHAKGATVFAGFLKILPMFIMVFPGMISRVMFPDEVACATAETCKKVCGSVVGCSNVAFPKLVLEIMPLGKDSFHSIYKISEKNIFIWPTRTTVALLKLDLWARGWVVTRFFANDKARFVWTIATQRQKYVLCRWKEGSPYPTMHPLVTWGLSGKVNQFIVSAEWRPIKRPYRECGRYSWGSANGGVDARSVTACSSVHLADNKY